MVVDEQTLRKLEQAVEKQCPHWHVWHSDAGKPWADTLCNPYGGSGVTITAPSLVDMPQAIRDEEHAWEQDFGWHGWEAA